MRMRSLAALLMSLLVLAMVGCGGGGGGGGGTTVPQLGAALSGVASKGPIRNGHIQIFEIVSTSRLLSPTPFFSGTTGADGSFSTNLPASLTKGGVMIQVLDGDYTDEATGAVKNIQTEYGASGMRSVIGDISSAVKQGSVSINVTPYTEMAVSDMNNVYDDSTTKLSQDKIQHAFGLDAKGIDIVHTRPLAFPAGTTAAEQFYSLALATISQYEKDFGTGKTLSGITHDLLVNHISRDGVLDQGTSDNIATATQTFIGGNQAPGPAGPGLVLPTKAIVKIGTAGVLPAGTLIGGVAATVVYANGHGLSITPANVVISGGGTGSSLAVNTNTAGQVVMGLINTNGIALGEYATLTFFVAAGNTTTAADFSIAPGSNVINVGTVKIPGISASIMSVTLQ